MNNEKMVEQKDFSFYGNKYSVVKSVQFEIVKKDSRIPVDESVAKNYLSLFKADPSAKEYTADLDNLTSQQLLKRLMEFLEEFEFVTYQRAVHIEIHENYCPEIAKHGGGTSKKVEYHCFRTLDEANEYAKRVKTEKELRGRQFDIRKCPRCM